MSANSNRATIIALFCATGMLVGSNTVQAEYDESKLQKLFTDKKQRAQIDAARTGDVSGTGSQQTSKVMVSGYVTRSGGKSVVWVNDKNTLESHRVGGVRVHQSSIGKNKKVTVSVDGEQKQLRPGEVWYKETGDVVENH